MTPHHKLIVVNLLADAKKHAAEHPEAQEKLSLVMADFAKGPTVYSVPKTVLSKETNEMLNNELFCSLAAATGSIMELKEFEDILNHRKQILKDSYYRFI